MENDYPNEDDNDEISGAFDAETGPVTRPTRYYIASGFGNADAVQPVKQALDAAGWHHTFDWTKDGNVPFEQLGGVATAEVKAVWQSDVVIVLLPGGRGTHTEMGVALASVAAGASKRICLVSADPADFTEGTTACFYWHPAVERFTSVEALLAALIGGAA